MISSKTLNKKAIIMNSKLIISLIFGFLTIDLRSQELPDNVNYVKYQQIYLEAKSISDAKRNQAESLRNQAQRLQNTLDSKISLLDSSKRTLQSNLQLMAQLDRDLPIWESQRTDTVNQINWNMDRLRSLDANLNQLNSNLRQINNQLQFQRSQLSSIDSQLRQASVDLQRVNQNLQTVESFLSQAPAQKQKLENEISQTTQRLQNIVESLEQIENGLPDIDTQITQAQASLDQAKKSLADIQPSLNQSKQALDQAQADFNIKKSKVDGLNKDLSDVTALIDTTDKDLKANNQRLAENESATVVNNQKRQALQSELVQLNQKLRDLIASSAPETEIKPVRDRISVIQQTELPRYEDENDLLIKAKARITTRIAALNSQLNDLRDRSKDLRYVLIPAAQQELTISQNGLTQAQSNFDSINQSVNSIKQSISSLEGSIRELNLSKEEVRKQIASLNQEKSELERSLAVKGQQLGDLQIRIDQAQRDLPTLRQQSAQLSSRVRDLQSQLSSQQVVVDRFVQQKYQTEQALQNTQFERNSVAQTLDRLNLNLSQLSAQIDQGKRSYQQAQSQNIILRSDIANLESEIPGLTSTTQNAWNQFKQADQEARPFEADTQIKLNKFVAVKSAYDNEIVQAKNKGSAQGVSQGQVAGRNQGEIDGVKLGTQEGSILGQQQGLIYGFEKGKVDGSSRGKIDGYQAGFTAPENYKDGLDRGLIQGKLNAQTQAMAQVYPKELARLKALLLSQNPSREVELDNLNQRFDQQGFGSRFKLSTGDVSGYSLDQKSILRQKMNSDSTLSRFAIVGNKVTSGIIFETHVVSILFNKSQADCQLRHPDFTNACLLAFEQAYKSSYADAYQRQHKLSYDSSKEVARLKAFEENKNVRYKEGYDLAYTPAFAQANLEGAQDAKNKGYADGLRQGFDSNIENENRIALQKAKIDNDNFFASNPVVRLRAAQLIKVASQFGTPVTDITAGDTLALKVDLVNLGLRDSKKGDVRIKLESMSSSLATENVVNDIISLPNQTLAKVRNSAIAKVTLSAIDEVAQLRLTALYPDGVSEERILDVKLKAFFVAGLDLSKIPLRPSAVNFAGNPNTTRFKISITNKAPIQAQDDVSIELSSPLADNGNGLAFITKQASFGRLGANATQDAEFGFRTAKTAVGKVFPITVQVKYGGRVILSETVEVRPK